MIGTQNKAAEIEIGSALHKHVVSSVQNAEVANPLSLHPKPNKTSANIIQYTKWKNRKSIN